MFHKLVVATACVFGLISSVAAASQARVIDNAFDLASALQERAHRLDSRSINEI